MKNSQSMMTRSDPSALPLVSVIMPVRNEAAFIERSLGAILAQDYPAQRLEILIADGQSEDATLAIIAGMQGAERVVILENPARIQAAGLNLMIQRATGEYVVRVDGHTIIAPDYVSECVRLLQATGAANAGGPMTPVATTFIGQAIAAAGRSPFAVPTAFHVSATPQYTDTVYLGAWPREVLRQAGGYNEQPSVNEDYELNIRIRAAGGRIYFSPTIRSDYYGRQTLRALGRQYYRYGRSKVKTLRLHPASLRPRQIVAPLFVAGLFGGLLAGLLIPALWPLYLLSLLLYVMLSLAASFVAARSQPELMPVLPMVFLTIHLAWGSGFWREFLRPSDHL